MNTSKLFCLFFIFSILLCPLESRRHSPKDSTQESSSSKHSSSKILPSRSLSVSAMAKIRLKYIEKKVPTPNALPLPSFINPGTIGKREFVHVMKVLRRKGQLSVSYSRNGHAHVKLSSDAKIKPLNRFLQKSVQKALASNE